MSRGRKSTPTALKKIRGTEQPCRANNTEMNINAIIKLPYAPRWFTNTQKDIYKNKGEQLRLLGILSILDFEVFISFCREYGNYIDTSKELEKIPLTSILNEQSEVIYRRLSKINKESWERAKALASEFGFTPSARVKMIMPSAEDDTDLDFD